MFEVKGILSFPKQRLTIAIQLGWQFFGINGMLAFISVIKFWKKKKSNIIHVHTIIFSDSSYVWYKAHPHTYLHIVWHEQNAMDISKPNHHYPFCFSLTKPGKNIKGVYSSFCNCHCWYCNYLAVFNDCGTGYKFCLKPKWRE